MIPDSAQAFLVPLLTLALGFFVSLRVGIILLLLVLVSGFFLQKMMGGSQFMKLYQESLNHLSAETVEYVRGIQVVKLFGNRLQSFKAMKEAIESYAKYAYEYSLSCKTPYVLYQWIFLGLIPILSIPLSFLLVKEPHPEKIIIDLCITNDNGLHIFYKRLTSFLQALFNFIKESKCHYARSSFTSSNETVNNRDTPRSTMVTPCNTSAASIVFLRCDTTINCVSLFTRFK